MDETQFYLWLPSNSSMDVFPSNTLTEFRVHLPQSIQLKGDWEVALTEIQYPHSWQTVRKDPHNHIYLGKQKFDEVVIIPNGHYSTLRSVIDSMNNQVNKSRYKDKANFTYNDLTRKVTVDLEKGNQVFFGDLSTMMGFGEKEIIKKTTTAKREADLELGFHNLYIYCDLVQPQLVGDSQVPLIRVIPVEGNDGDRITARFTSPQYLPVSRKQFETVEINIKRDTGEKVPFQFGRVLVTLHFRRANPYFN